MGYGLVWVSLESIFNMFIYFCNVIDHPTIGVPNFDPCPIAIKGIFCIFLDHLNQLMRLCSVQSLALAGNEASAVCHPSKQWRFSQIKPRGK